MCIYIGSNCHIFLTESGNEGPASFNLKTISFSPLSLAYRAICIHCFNQLAIAVNFLASGQHTFCRS